jgi:hypothetical protein
MQYALFFSPACALHFLLVTINLTSYIYKNRRKAEIAFLLQRFTVPEALFRFQSLPLTIDLSIYGNKKLLYNNLMEKHKQEILRYIHSKNNIWTALVVSTSSTIALLFNHKNLLENTFFVIGVLFSILFLALYKSRSRYIDRLIEKVGEKDEHV